MYFLFALLLSCANPKNLVYQDVKNFRIAKLDLKHPEIGLDIQFYNPNNFGMSLKDANIDIYINNNFIGKAVLSNIFNVPAKNTFLLPVNLSANLKNIFPSALQLAFNKDVTVKLQGSVKAGRGVFINIPINYEGKQKLNVR